MTARAFFTPPQLAERWGCSTRQVYRLVESGRMAALSIGSRGFRIPADAVEAYERTNTRKAVR